MHNAVDQTRLALLPYQRDCDEHPRIPRGVSVLHVLPHEGSIGLERPLAALAHPTPLTYSVFASSMLIVRKFYALNRRVELVRQR